MFCHTSVQAVCHSITAIFMDVWKPNINTTSGLFLRRCPYCGLELRLGPLHALVVVTFCLADSGLTGETLFGMLACLTCLLTLNADPSARAEISMPAILGTVGNAQCQHRLVDAAELASDVPVDIVQSWTPEVQLGWEAITALLRHRIHQQQSSKSNESVAQGELFGNPVLEARGDGDTSSGDGDSEIDVRSNNNGLCSHNIHNYEAGYDTQLILCADRRLGIIWAAIQVELLNYRRLKEGDPWLSHLFDLRKFVEGLQSSDDRTVERLVDDFGENAFQPFSQCGLFFKADDPGRARREEACRIYFANLEDWRRTKFIEER